MGQQSRGGFQQVLVLILLWLGGTRVGWALVISEIQYHPVDQSLEFIELYNDRAVFEDMGGYAFTDGIDFVFPDDTIFPAKSYLVVAADPNALEQAYGIKGVMGPYSGHLSNSGEKIVLSNDNGGILLSMTYKDRSPWSLIPDGTGHSLIRVHLGGDPQDFSTWGPSFWVGGTPGGPDPSLIPAEPPVWDDLLTVGSMGRYFKGLTEPSLDQNGLPTTHWTEINFSDNPNRTDWLEGPSGYGYSDNSTELQNIHTLLSDMRDHYVSIYVRLPFTLTTAQIKSFGQLRANVIFDDAYVLYLNGTRVGASSVLSQTPPPFDTTTGSGSDPAPEQVDLTPYIGLLQEGTNILALQVHNASIGGSSDCIAAAGLQALEDTEEQFEADTLSGRLLINEVLTSNLPHPPSVELYNPGPAAMSFKGLYLSHDHDDLLQHKLPVNVVLQPGEFWTETLTPVAEGGDMSLDVSDETLYLTQDDSQHGKWRVLDAFYCGATQPGLSTGCWPDGAERVVPLSEPTLGVTNARPYDGDLVINELMYHPISDDERYEYVELFNRSSEIIPLAGWVLSDGIEYTFPNHASIAPGGYVVVAQDPDWLSGHYEGLVVDGNCFGPYTGHLSHHSDRLVLSRPVIQADHTAGLMLEDEVTYYDGGAWPSWADGGGCSLELRDPYGDNDDAGAWEASDESGKTDWQPFSFTVAAGDQEYTHDSINLVDLMLLNPGEVWLDDLQCIVNGQEVLTNGGFEDGLKSWRVLGNHVQSSVSAQDAHSGKSSLHLVATGRGDPGGNRINQSIGTVTARTVTLKGWARWQRGSQFLLMRTARERTPVQPPRPAHTFTLQIPIALGTPGRVNSRWVDHRGPSITEVTHQPVIPAAGEPIVVTARILDQDPILLAALSYHTESRNDDELLYMVDDGSGDDLIAGDHLYTATIPGAEAGAMRAFSILTTDGHDIVHFPPSGKYDCLVRVADTPGNTALATYRVWMSDEVIKTFTHRTNLSNELMPCTFVYNDSEVFYNAKIRLRSSPWLRGGSGWSPVDRHAFRLEFPGQQRFRGRVEINLDNTEVQRGGGPLQERASYWFFRKMGLPYSRHEFVRLILNGNNYGSYEDVQKVDGDYIDHWFPQDNEGYLYEIDDYFEFNAAGTNQHNLDDGVRYDSRHPLLKETFRWEIEKRSHRENDDWEHLFNFAVQLNTSATQEDYESHIEAVLHPEEFAAEIALRHMVGDWDTYGNRRGKNASFYYAPGEDKWYLLPWDIDFTLGSGDGPTTTLPPTNSSIFPEVAQFLNHDKYRRLYWQFIQNLVEGPWQTSYQSDDPPTEFDRFLDDATAVLQADGQGTARRDAIKQFVLARRNYVLNQLQSLSLSEN